MLADSCFDRFALQVFTEMHSMPNGEQALVQDQEGEDSVEESGEWESPGEEDEESEESGEEEEVYSPPRSERRSKQQHDPSGGRVKSVAPSATTQKRTRTSTPEPTEKVAKQPKVAPSKTWKTLPRIKMDVPVASGWVSCLCFRKSTEDFLDLTDQFLCPSSPTSAATDMDIDKAPGDEEATSRAGKFVRPSSV